MVLSYWGIFEDNDPTKRLIAIANVNDDISEYWELSDTGFAPVDLNNEAYKFGDQLRDLRDDTLDRRTSWLS